LFEPGDVLTHVAGTPVAGLETRAIYQLVPTTYGATVSVTVERQGQPLQLNVKLEPKSVIRLVCTVIGKPYPRAVAEENKQCFDIIFRHSLLTRCVPVGRSLMNPRFRDDMNDRMAGCPGFETWRGHYQSLNPCPRRMTLNLDLTTHVFTKPMNLADFVRELRVNPREPAAFHHVRGKIIGLQVTTIHRPDARPIKIKAFCNMSAARMTFPKGDREVSVQEHIETTYQRRLRNPDDMLVECTGGKPDASGKPTLQLLPMELLMIVDGQRVRKMDPVQTAACILKSKQRPAEKRRMLQEYVRELDLNRNVSAQFGLTVDDSRLMTVPARVLEPPKLSSGGSGTIIPREGAWNMNRDKFFKGGELINWGVLGFVNNWDRVNAVAELLGQKAHDKGMMVRRPHKVALSNNTNLRNARSLSKEDVLSEIGSFADTLHSIAKRGADERGESVGRLNLVVIVVPQAKTDPAYACIKWATEVQLGFPTQVVALATFDKQKRPDQYITNIMLKVNSKVGGINYILDSSSQLPILGDRPFCVFGIDVSHPGPGSFQPSVAAVTCSVDPHAAQHIGTFRAQMWHNREDGGRTFIQRQEVVMDLKSMVVELLRKFYAVASTKPERILVYRDGVSEGQFATVLQEELGAFKRAFRDLQEDYDPPITFVTTQKRHHTRIFAESQRDEEGSGNLMPGTVVDTNIVGESMFDFYLMSHAGIRGPTGSTTRAAKYSVLWDENQFDYDTIQAVTWRLSHIYARCTRSVSIPPAVAYADRLALRAAALMQELGLSGLASDSGSVSGSSTARDQQRREMQRAGAEFVGTFKVDDKVLEQMYFV